MRLLEKSVISLAILMFCLSAASAAVGRAEDMGRGNTVYFGRYPQTDLGMSVPSAASAGVLSIHMPNTLTDGTHTLKVFSEQANGDYLTDFAGGFTKMTVTVSGGGTAAAVSNFGGTVLSGAAADVTSPKYVTQGRGLRSYFSARSDKTSPGLNLL
ncbi:MAG: hypothetical protein LBS53_05390 [Synergistaceae bacterium]|jgi:hypothetical protein|nr:hypothetical protein [Synergistaceae bacterium]